MAWEEALQTRTYEAGGDLSGLQYRFCKQTGDDQVVGCDAAGEAAIGVIQNDPDEQEKATTVAVGGISKVEAGAELTVGQAVSTDNQGRAIPATTGHVVLGHTRLAASEAGVLTSVELTVPFRGTAS
jgi:hypothetical protein